MIQIGDKVKPLSGRYKGNEFTVEMIATGTLGETHLYLTRGHVVIFKTMKQVEVMR